MSLNFVSTSVLSSTDGVSHDTETEIKPSAALSQQQHKPLYEQLRENAAREKEKFDEMEKAMKGVTALNEEDAAFIQSVESRKLELKSDARRREEEEIQLFRAVRMEKSLAIGEEVDNITDFMKDDSLKHVADIHTNNNMFSPESSSLTTIKPKIIRKRRRPCDKIDFPVKKSEAKQDNENGCSMQKWAEDDASLENISTTVETATTTGNPLSSLLCYSSDSDKSGA
mmetsp:Transcript_9280/g.17483  ORF Transcript_9280/g.17483 Transcript_9280/m.17483 type:complete len:227 (+) Transcript_9280:680-1360(+)|eukprot:CAMPEP_0176494890 /NCGR_PEP_ID=MMETSP0200_2-20121128/10354_1 /TAXON_ID=947934 /ORGANISM="Chaetoceros sp., Strain GSL56" /LENGTH=226 /DNA_ID=CAMNT_0017892711 /DNA_START=615 /DNA_END=1295 /DNA_ORIENTATION=-